MSPLPTDASVLTAPAEDQRSLFRWHRQRSDGKRVEEVVLFRLLTTRDKHLARLNAENRVRELAGAGKYDSKTLDELTADQRTIESLAQAMRKVDDPNIPWRTPAEIEMLPEIEIALLSKAYTEFEDTYGPLDHELSLEKLDHWIELAAKNETDFLVLLASPTRRACFSLMARELLTLRAGRSSATSLASDGSGSNAKNNAETVATLADLDALEGRLAAEMNGRLDELTRQVGSLALTSGRAHALDLPSDPDDGAPVVDHG